MKSTRFMSLSFFMIFAFIFMSSIFTSCEPNSNSDQIAKPDQKKDIIFDVKTEQNDSTIILCTNYTVWKDGKLIRTFSKRDTLPSVGTKEIEEEVYDEYNDEYSYPTTTVPDSYNLYINTK